MQLLGRARDAFGLRNGNKIFELLKVKHSDLSSLFNCKNSRGRAYQHAA
jgi:hypothetical protein